MTTIHAADVSTRAEITEILAAANDDAKAISRRGMSAMLRAEYAEAHAVVNDLLSDLLGAP